MTPRRSQWLLKVLGEAAVIFVGMVLALAADDWRETRSERQEAHASLALLIADLRLDSAEFARMGPVLERHGRTAASLIEGWDRIDMNSDSAETALFQFYSGGFLRFHRTAYEGLRDSNRLRLIEDDSIQASIRAYYQIRQANISNYWDQVALVGGTALAMAMAPHVRSPKGREPGSLWPALEPRVPLRHPWRAVSSDAALEQRVYAYGVYSSWLAGLLSEGEVAAGDLIRLLSSRLRAS